MRDIRFRGKLVDNGEWVYGNLINNDEIAAQDNTERASLNPQGKRRAAFIVGRMLESYSDYCVLQSWEPVDPETVGQFTGLKDKNGVDIYEGDVIQYRSTLESAEVTFVGGHFGYRDAHCHNIIFANCVEVIGNTRDNPELLEE